MSRVAIVAAVALFAVSSAYKYTPTEPTCTATGEKCAGAPGKPYVPYAKCCDETKECAADPSLGWGRFCVDKPMPYGTYAPKCYKAGERCMGAPGKPYVDYYPCCDGSPCVEDAAMGYGGFCKPPPKDYYGKPEEPMCYAESERCMGAPGKPYVPYHPCCAGECVKDAAMGYGYFCKPTPPTKDYGYYEKTEEDNPVMPSPEPKSYY